MIRTFSWTQGEPAATAGTEPPASLPADGSVVWIDLVQPTPEEEAKVFQTFFPVHPLTIEDITRPRRLADGSAHLPKVEEFPDYLFSIVNPLPVPHATPDPAQRTARNRPQLSAVLTQTVLITHHYEPLPCVDSVWAYASRHAGCVGRGPDYLFHLILDAMVDEYAPVVERIAGRLDRIEARMFEQTNHGHLTQLLRAKRRISFLRKTLILEREVLARLMRGEFALVEQREIAYYRNVYDHLVRYTELIENAREMVSDLMQTHLAAASNRLNEVMKLLTMFSAIILPMSLIAGIYGMNFKTLPELEWPYGYPFALGLMLLTGLIGFIFFRWKRWI
jgi:magnesium transporter